jgi:hypothetical protein
MYIYDLVSKQKLMTGQLTIPELIPGLNLRDVRYGSSNPPLWFARGLQQNGIYATMLELRRPNYQKIEYKENYSGLDIENECYSYYTVVLGGLTFDILASDTVFPTNKYFSMLKKKYPDIQVVPPENIIMTSDNSGYRIDIDYLANMNIEKFDLPIASYAAR